MCARVHKRRGAVEASLPSCKCDKCVRTCSRVPPRFTCAYKGSAMLKRQVTSEGGQLAGERWRSVCARGGRVEGLEFRARRSVYLCGHCTSRLCLTPVGKKKAQIRTGVRTLRPPGAGPAFGDSLPPAGRSLLSQQKSNAQMLRVV